MGRQIVYCEGCGSGLREDDFERGRARLMDNRPFCTECRPFKEPDAKPQSRRASSGRVPTPSSIPRKTSTGHIPILTPPPRRTPAKGPEDPLPILAGAGAVAFIVLMYAVTQGGTRPTSTSEPPPPPPPTEIPVPRAIPEPPLARELPPSDREDLPALSSQQSRSGPLVAPSTAEKLDAFLLQIQQMIQTDVRRERTNEILGMFAAAHESAGPRASEVERMKSDYVSSLEEPVRRAASWTDWKITSSPQTGASGLVPSYADRTMVYVTRPLGPASPACLERQISLPAGRKSVLSFSVMGSPSNGFELRVWADGKKLVQEAVGPMGAGWIQKSVDLSQFSGRRITLRLEDAPGEPSYDRAYWSELAITTE